MKAKAIFRNCFIRSYLETKTSGQAFIMHRSVVSNQNPKKPTHTQRTKIRVGRVRSQENRQEQEGKQNKCQKFQATIRESGYPE